MPMFRPKDPLEALQWKGPTDCEELKAMAGYRIGFDATGVLMVITQAGICRANIGDWIIKLAPGEFIVRTNDQFAANYEEVTP